MILRSSFAFIFAFISTATIAFADSPSLKAPIRVERNDSGPAISQKELSAATDDLISIIEKTKYFDFADSRIHGWPESDSRYPWWGHMWSGVSIQKRQGKVSYVHSKYGTDNVAIATASYLEGACFAYTLTGNKKLAHLTQKMIRAYGAWVNSSATNSKDLMPVVLNRDFYPASVEAVSPERTIFFNFDASRPGINNPKVTSYVHLANNPFFGDIYIKNKRSIDDIGQIIRSLVITQETCASAMSQIPQIGKQVTDDFKITFAAYSRWSQDVDANNFKVPTLNEHGKYDASASNLNDYRHYEYFGKNPICVGPYAIRLLHSNSPGNINCRDGHSWWENILRKYLHNDAYEILRTHHEAAVALSQLRGLTGPGTDLLRGLGNRVTEDFSLYQSDNPPNQFNKEDVPQLLIESANVGVSLTSSEIRVLHQRLHNSEAFFSAASQTPTFHVFDAATPDGDYSYKPPETRNGIYFKLIGSMIGSCSSAYRNNTRPVFDCEKLQSALDKILN